MSGVAIGTVDTFLQKKRVGSSDTTEFDKVDAFMRKLADKPVTESDLLHSAVGWGALEEMLLKKSLASGAFFPKNVTKLKEERELRPFVELVVDGTFSEQSLNEHAVSFQTTLVWMNALKASASKHGDTWLHNLHLGIGHLNLCVKPDDEHFNISETYFKKSLSLLSTADALRNLAIISHARLDHDKAFEYYEEALKAAITSQSKDPYGAKLYIRDLVGRNNSFNVTHCHHLGSRVGLSVCSVGHDQLYCKTDRC
eukprot:m.220763 g.220763  ORF g.220763 m.220763 type:complete len:255 (+) comp15921_c0_seq12:39-803(+)